MAAPRASRKRLYIASALGVVLVAAVAGFAVKGASTDIDPGKLVTAEKGTMVKSVVATGKIEPTTKVEIKSKANGIIEKMNVDVDQIVRPSDVLVELDKENLRAQVRESHANLQAAKAAQEAAAAQLSKDKVAAEAPDLEFAKRNYDRAQQLYAQKLVSPQSLDDAKSAMDMAKNRKAGAEVQLGISQAKLSESARRLMKIRGIGATTALAIVATVGNAREFKNGRQFAAWIGLVPGQYSTGGKARLGHISKRGDAYLRNLLVQGARSVLQTAPAHQDRFSRWALELQQRRGYYRTLVAIANKNARIAWALLAKNEQLRTV
jgi:multidrug efflux pump subunit AcrA (membrane-fusion protein)